MTPLLCRLGLHAPTWHRLTDHDGATRGWLHIRTCKRCGHHIGKRHR